MTATYVVLATDRVSGEGLVPITEDERFHVISVDDSSQPEFEAVLPEASGLIVRSATRVTRGMMEQAPNLKVVGRAGVGLDNIDMGAASARGVAVINAPGGNTVSAAELTMALLLAVARRVVEADRSLRQGRWERARLAGVELRGKTLGLVGAGRIGGEVAQLCRAFGMVVIAVDPLLTPERAQALRVRGVDLDEVLKTADVVSLHVPLNEETKGMIDAAALDSMKPDAFVINTSRGGVVDEVALARALREGRIAGAALDVYEVEPIAGDSPLFDAPNLVLTPHLGASTREAQVQVAREVADGIRLALAHGDLSMAINASEISGSVGLS